MKKILITGNHPLAPDLVRQYEARGDQPVWLPQGEPPAQHISEAQEVCLLASADKPAQEADNEVMTLLSEVAAACQPAEGGHRRLLCHLLLRSQTLLHLIRTEGFLAPIEERLEVCPFTMEDQWGQTLALTLDREPITVQSVKTVHLVIFGMSSMAELVALNAAHICHFPNFAKNPTLRTRITLIDEQAQTLSTAWTRRYPELFDNSLYRLVDTRKRPAVTATMPDQQRRADIFTDVEWEFVEASPYDPLVRSKLQLWTTSGTQQLTVVFAGEDTEQALSDALHLPDELSRAGVPTYVYMKSDQALRMVAHGGGTAIRPFGMLNRGYDINIPYIQMAKTVNYVYNQCRIMQSTDGTWKMEYVVEVDRDRQETLWAQLSFNKRMSSVYNAMTIGVKMRSMGFHDDDWAQLYDLSLEEIETLAQVEHNRWNVEELILGWRPCTPEEQRQVEADPAKKVTLKQRKVHYDLRPYSDLRPDDSGKPAQIYDRCLSACIPLIAKESKGGKK